MQLLPDKRREEIAHLVSLCESNILETQLIFPKYSELARTLFSFESTNNIKLK